MLKCMGDDPMDPANWTTADESNLYEVQANPGDPLAFTNFSLDMTYFEADGQSYVAWAEKPNNISKIYLCFSGAAVDYTYCIGMISADEGADLLDLSSWTKYPTPLLSSDDFEDQCGTGHNSFTYDENGNPVLVYHARPVEDCSNGMDADGNYGHCEYEGPGQNALNDPCRHARVKSINFAADGTPVLNMTEEEELSAANEQVTVKIIVTDNTEDYVTVTYEASEGGRIDGQAVQTILKGEDAQTVTAVAEEGYVFAGWSDGLETAERTDTDVQENLTVTAQFEKEPADPDNPDPEDPDDPQPSEVDKSQLQAAVDTYKDVDRNLYTDASWQAWKTAYDNAVTVLEDEDAVQDEVDQALADLKAALAVAAALAGLRRNRRR